MACLHSLISHWHLPPATIIILKVVSHVFACLLLSVGSCRKCMPSGIGSSPELLHCVFQRACVSGMSATELRELLHAMVRMEAKIDWLVANASRSHGHVSRAVVSDGSEDGVSLDQPAGFRMSNAPAASNAAGPGAVFDKVCS